MNTDLTPSLRRHFPSPEAPQKRRKRPETKPFCLRFTEDERTRLEAAAGGIPLGTFIRGLVLGAEVKPRRSRALHNVKDGEALGRVLGALGQSRIANNLNQLAKAVHVGALEVTPQTEAEIVSACGSVALMRADLMRALGLIEVGSA